MSDTEARVEEIAKERGDNVLSEECCGIAARHLGKNVYPENWHSHDCNDDLCESLGGDASDGMWIARMVNAVPFLLDAYTKMRAQRDAERERAERAEAELHEAHEGCDPDCIGYSDCQHPQFGNCWYRKRVPLAEYCKSILAGGRRPEVRILTEYACPICVRVLGKEQS